MPPLVEHPDWYKLVQLFSLPKEKENLVTSDQLELVHTDAGAWLVASLDTYQKKIELLIFLQLLNTLPSEVRNQLLELKQKHPINDKGDLSSGSVQFLPEVCYRREESLNNTTALILLSAAVLKVKDVVKILGDRKETVLVYNLGNKVLKYEGKSYNLVCVWTGNPDQYNVLRNMLSDRLLHTRYIAAQPVSGTISRTRN